MDNNVSATRVGLPTRSANNDRGRSLSVGRVWINQYATAENRQPAMRGIIDNNLPIELMLKAGARFALFPNIKREGKNDPDFRLSIEGFDTETADYVINLQRGRTGEVTAPEQSSQASLPLSA